MMREPNRGTGRSYAQMLVLPDGALFIVPNRLLAGDWGRCPVLRLAERGIELMPARQFVDGLYKGRRWSAIEVDHACWEVEGIDPDRLRWLVRVCAAGIGLGATAA